MRLGIASSFCHHAIVHFIWLYLPTHHTTMPWLNRGLIANEDPIYQLKINLGAVTQNLIMQLHKKEKKINWKSETAG